MALRTLISIFFFFLMIRRPPRSTLDRSSAASDVYKRQDLKRFAMRISPDLGLIRLQAESGRVLSADFLFGFQCPLLYLSGYSITCLLYTSPSPRDRTRSRMPSSA